MNNPQNDIHSYLIQAWWPIVITLIFEIAALFTDNSGTLIIVANIFLIIYIIAKTKITDYRLAAWVNGTVILFTSLIIALVKFMINFKFLYLFNIITEPLIYASGAAILSAGLVLTINKIKIN
ncbi:MAG: hypothetical protein V1898_03385 [Patescibacteria group bacterium]